MKQILNKFTIVLRILTLALLLVGMLVLTPGPVGADDPDIHPVGEPRGIGMGSGLSGSGEAVDSGVSGLDNSFIIFSQPPVAATSQNWEAWNSSRNALWDYKCMDDFWGLNDNIDDIHWYGLAMVWDDNSDNPGFIVGNPSGMQFEITFYQDNNGSPGAMAAEFSSIIPSHINYAKYQYENIGYQTYRFDVAGLDVPAGLTHGWVSIQSTYSPSNSQFLWLISPSGNRNAVQNSAPDAPEEIDGNFSFALTKIAPPVPGVSFWGGILLVLFFSIILVRIIHRKQISR
jgi:hypothetical protein